jgi:hypothetical protein
MHFLLVVLRFVLDRLVPSWRDGLRMAIRSDGRIEQIPTRPGRWGQWLSLLAREVLRLDEGRDSGGRAKDGRDKVRAGRGARDDNALPRDRAARA